MRHLSVFFGVLLSWHVLLVPQTDACDWRADLFDYTTNETTHFRRHDTSVKIPLVNVDKGVNVQCRLEPAAVLSIGIFLHMGVVKAPLCNCDAVAYKDRRQTP
jgi:hypothetical protein